MGERLSSLYNLTREAETARHVWDDVTTEIKSCGREDVLQSPTVLDIGGGMGEFSKYLNGQGIRSISLDKKDLEVPPEANPVRATAYQMPFADATFNIVHGSGVFDVSIVHGHGILDSFIYPHDFPKLVAEIARVLAPRGILSIYDGNPPPASELEKLFARLSKQDKDFPTLWEKK